FSAICSHPIFHGPFRPNAGLGSDREPVSAHAVLITFAHLGAVECTSVALRKRAGETAPRARPASLLSTVSSPHGGWPIHPEQEPRHLPRPRDHRSPESLRATDPRRRFLRCLETMQINSSRSQSGQRQWGSLRPPRSVNAAETVC